MSAVSIREIPRRSHPAGARGSAVAMFVLVALLAAAEAALLVNVKASYAFVFAALPLGAFLFSRTRTVLLVALLPVLATTMVIGHAFAEIRVGPVYVLDATVAMVVVLAAPAIVQAIGRNTGVAAILGLFLLITAVHVYEAGATRIVLRQSVIGIYALWVIVGIVVARANVLTRYMRVFYWAAAGAIVVAIATNSLHDVSHDLYMGYGLMLALFAPTVVARRQLAYPIVIAQIAVIGLGQVRSTWVALPLSIATTLFVCGRSSRFTRQIVRLSAVTILLFVLALAARPSVISALSRQANSIFNYSGSTTSDANARWRLSNWTYGVSQIRAHPLTGIGFGGPEVPPSVCTTGCNDLSQNPDPTVLAGSDLHNSILAIPLRLGLPALLVFLAFEWAVVSKARRFGRHSATMQWLLACHLLTAFTALTAVVLEGPYMGIFFWFFGGLVLGFTPSQTGLPSVDADGADRPAIVSAEGV